MTNAPEQSATTSTASAVIDPKALGATFARYVVPAIVGLLVSWAAKVGFTLTSTQAYAYVAPAVAAVYSTALHFAEAKVPALGLLLGAKRPAKLTK